MIGIYEVSYRKFIDGQCVVEDNPKYRKRFFRLKKAISYAEAKSGESVLQGYAGYYAIFNRDGLDNFEVYMVTTTIWFDMLQELFKRKDPLH